MYSDRTYNHWVLVPLWIVHIIILLFFVGVLALNMMEYAGDHNGAENPTFAVFMVLFCIALVMEPLEMVLHSYRLLEPWVYLSFQIYKVVFGTTFTVIEIIEYTRMDWTAQEWWIRVFYDLLIAASACITVSSVCSLVYGAVALRRHRKIDPDYDLVYDKSEKSQDGWYR